MSELQRLMLVRLGIVRVGEPSMGDLLARVELYRLRELGVVAWVAGMGRA